MNGLSYCAQLNGQQVREIEQPRVLEDDNIIDPIPEFGESSVDTRPIGFPTAHNSRCREFIFGPTANYHKEDDRKSEKFSTRLATN